MKNRYKLYSYSTLLGPTTIFFWAPTFKWGLVIAGIGDINRPAEKISLSQTASLMLTGAIWSRYFIIHYMNDPAPIRKYVKIHHGISDFSFQVLINNHTKELQFVQCKYIHGLNSRIQFFSGLYVSDEAGRLEVRPNKKEILFPQKCQ